MSFHFVKSLQEENEVTLTMVLAEAQIQLDTILFTINMTWIKDRDL